MSVRAPGARTIHHPCADRIYGLHVPSSTAAMDRTERVSTAIRLPKELHESLRRHASERDVSVNFLVTRAVYHYLDQLPPADPLAEDASQEGAAP